jgi:alpha-beta hydrolase superfamily lysophospholipase
MLRDGDDVLPQARTLLLHAGRQTRIAAVLIHGLTNNPAQFASFAPLLHAAGVNVLVPRIPLHGYRDRLTTKSALVTAEMLIASTEEAVDLACGLGEQIVVLGISAGGLLAAYVAQFRPIATAVSVAPSFALLRLPYAVSRLVERCALVLPNRFLWWNPMLRERQTPPTAYPRFSTRALAQSLRVGDAVYDAARRQPPLARRIATVVNCNDPAVNNAVTKRVAAAWSAWNSAEVAYVEMTDWPRMHDVLDPQQRRARIDLVYPKLLDLLGVTLPA